MKTRIADARLSIGLTTVNLVLWVWATMQIKKLGDHLEPPLLIALIAMMIAALIQYRAVVEARQK